MNKSAEIFPKWSNKALLLAFLYYLICGLTAIFLPKLWLFAAGVSLQDYQLPLAVTGVLLCALAIGALLASFAPKTQWALVGALLAANIIDILMLILEIRSERLPLINASLFIIIDAAWVYVFAKLLLAQKNYADLQDQEEKISLDNVLQIKPKNSTLSIAELSKDNFLILFHVRHGGCTFCREHLAQLAIDQKSWPENHKLIIVGMSPAEDLQQLSQNAGLKDYFLISDPERKLYRAFGIEQGNLTQLLGPKVLWHTIKNKSLQRFGIGIPAGNVRQLPGMVIIKNSQIIAKKVAETANQYCEIDFSALSEAN